MELLLQDVRCAPRVVHVGAVKYANCESLWTAQLVTPHRKDLFLHTGRANILPMEWTSVSAVRTESTVRKTRSREFRILEGEEKAFYPDRNFYRLLTASYTTLIGYSVAKCITILG